MLVLTRKPNQSILIGEDIEIRVLQVRGEQVRLGIRAPNNVPIYREEILQVTQSKEVKGPEGSPKDASESEVQDSSSAAD